MNNDTETLSQFEGSNKIAGLYNIGKTIGKGHFAVVKEAKHVFTQEKVAIKIIDKTKLDQYSKEQLLSEVMCMKLVQHPNIVRLYEVIDTTHKLYLVIELGDGGDLYDYILNQGQDGLKETEAKHYFRQIVRAIAYCHKLHVVHRDIKPENVVFFKNSNLVKLTDFGFSNKFIPGETLKTSCGSLAYSAPEILLGDSYDAPKVDIWSLGVILFMLVVGSLPFCETNDSETIARIMDCKYKVPEYVSQPCRDLIQKMLVRDANNRANLDAILNDEWLSLTDEDNLECEIENYTIPLISQEHLSLEDHLEILTKMSDGHLASVDETQRILDIGEYNHISATYFLLAERKLKRKYLEYYAHLCSQRVVIETNSDKYKKIASIASQPSFDGTARRISMILEGEESEEDEELDTMSSLANFRRELERFIPCLENGKIGENSSNLSGTAAPCPSRCVSRINSATELYYGSDDYDSDAGSIILRSRRRKRSSNIRSLSSVSSRVSSGYVITTTNSLHSPDDFAAIDQIAKDYYQQQELHLSQSDRKRKYLTQIPESIASIPALKKSFSVTDISSRRKMIPSGGFEFSTPVWNTSVHKFSRSSVPTPRYSTTSNNYSARQSVVNDKRFNQQTFFDTGSNSTTANCSSPDNSDVENDMKSKLNNSKQNKKFETQSSDLSDGRDVCHPIREEDEFGRSRNSSSPSRRNHDSSFSHCFRSRSFDARFNCTIANETANKEFCNCKSPNCWSTTSISNLLAHSNFSLSSFATKLCHPNMMQLIRSTYELHIHNQTENRNSSRVKSHSSALSGAPLSPQNSSIPTPRMSKIINKKLRTSSRLKKFLLLKSLRNPKSVLKNHSNISSSISCQNMKAEPVLVGASSIPQLNSSMASDVQKSKSHLFLMKRDHMACCILC